jgi:hypothetical protein
MTSFSKQQGLTAADQTPMATAMDPSKFRETVERHFTWGCRELSPFISLFSNREHAENWALKEPWRSNEPIKGFGWHLYVINTRQLVEDRHLYKLSDLVRGLGVVIPPKAQQHIGGGFLCLQQIPPAAIVAIKDPNQVKKGSLVLYH